VLAAAKLHSNNLERSLKKDMRTESVQRNMFPQNFMDFRWYSENGGPAWDSETFVHGAQQTSLCRFKARMRRHDRSGQGDDG
jgi:hypothetical protein